MSYAHPPNRKSSGLPVDPEEVNEAWRPFVEELTGALNEHNFAPALTSTDAERTGLVLAGAPHHIEADREDTTALINPFQASPTNTINLVQNGQWNEIIAIDVTVKFTCMVLIVGVACCTADFWTATSILSPEQGVKFAIGIDGVPQPNTGPGDFDEPNSTFPRNPAGPHVQGSTGIRRSLFPVRCFYVGQLTEGQHRLALLGKGVKVDLGHPIRVFTRQIFSIQSFGSRRFVGA